MRETTDPLLNKIQHFIEQIPFVRELLISVVEAGRGAVILGLSPQVKLFNHFDTYQAGVLFTLAEITGGSTLATFLDPSRNLILTKRGEISFQSTTGSTVLSESVVEEALIERVISDLGSSRKIYLPVEVKLRTQEGKVVALCSFSYYLRLGIPRSFAGAAGVKRG